MCLCDLVCLLIFFYWLIIWLIDWCPQWWCKNHGSPTFSRDRSTNSWRVSFTCSSKVLISFTFDYCSPLLITGRVWGTHTDLCTNQKPSSVGVTMFNVTKFYTTTLLRSQFSMIWVEAVTVDSSAGCNSSHRFVLMRSFWYVIVIIIYGLMTHISVRMFHLTFMKGVSVSAV